MKNIPTKFGYLPVAAISNEEKVDAFIARYIPVLHRYGGQRWHAGMISRPAPLFFFIVTGGTEGKILDLREKRRQMAPKEPVLLVAHPGNNSLPAALEVLARLQQDGNRGKIFYLSGPEATASFRQISEAAGDVKAFHALRQARIGLMGAPSDWLVASSPDPETVHQVWGPQVLPMPWEELKAIMAAVGETELQPTLDSLLSKAAELREPSPTEVSDAVRVYLALKHLSSDRRLDAVTIRCFDLIQELKTTACFALSQLNDQGLVAGCEGDLASTVAMLWIRKLLDQTSWMANPAQVDTAENALWLAHCTIPRSMAKAYRLRSHFESGLGVGIEGQLAEGPVTVFRIGGRSLQKLWCAQGQLLQTGDAQNLCRTQVKVHITEGGRVEELLRAPLGNHLVLVRGHHAHGLHRWWQMMMAQTP